MKQVLLIYISLFFGLVFMISSLFIVDASLSKFSSAVGLIMLLIAMKYVNLPERSELQ